MKTHFSKWNIYKNKLMPICITDRSLPIVHLKKQDKSAEFECMTNDKDCIDTINCEACLTILKGVNHE